VAKLYSRKVPTDNAVSINGNTVNVQDFQLESPVIVQFLNSYESPKIGLQKFFDLWTQMLELMDESDHMNLLDAKELLELMQKQIEDSLTFEVKMSPCSMGTLDQIKIVEIHD